MTPFLVWSLVAEVFVIDIAGRALHVQLPPVSVLTTLCSTVVDVLFRCRPSEDLRERVTEVDSVPTLVCWVAQQLLMTLVVLGHAAGHVLLGAPDGRLLWLPSAIAAAAVITPLWEVCHFAFGGMMPYIRWALTRNEFKANGSSTVFWEDGGTPRWSELITSL